MEVHGRIAALDHLVEVGAVNLFEVATERAHVVEHDVDDGFRIVGLEGESGLFLADRSWLVQLEFRFGSIRLIDEVAESSDECECHDDDGGDDRHAGALLTAQLFFALFAKLDTLRFAHVLR